MEWYFMKPNRTKQSNFINAAHRLEEAVVDYRNIPNDTVRDGVIQRFEFTFELAWKALKEYILEVGIQIQRSFPSKSFAVLPPSLSRRRLLPCRCRCRQPRSCCFEASYRCYVKHLQSNDDYHTFACGQITYQHG